MTERIATARHEAGLTQKDLADRLGVSLWTVERLESGQTDPVTRLDELARATGKPEAWFMPANDLDPRLDAVTPAEQPKKTDTGLLLILASFAALIVIRFFTEVVHVLPRSANFIDIPIFFALVVAAALRPRPVHGGRDMSAFAIPAILFLLVCAMATLANPSRVEAAPVLVFVYGYLAPIGVYFATYRLWPVGSALSLSRLIVALGLVQLAVVVLIDLPRFFASNDPDQISGTFGENGYQLVFFLLLFTGLLAGIFTFEHRRPAARAAPLLSVAVLATIFLVQYRSLILTTALTVALIGVVLGTVRLRGLILGALVGIAFLATLSYTAKALPFLRLDPVVQTLATDPTSLVADRAGALNHVGKLYSDSPRYIVTGTGPGTYASRSWQTFGLFNSTSQSNVAGAYAGLLVGGHAYHTDVSDKYVYPRVRYGETVQGSFAVKLPYSDYTSLLAEVGLFGFAAIVFIYLRGLFRAGRITLNLRRRSLSGDPLPALALATLVAFFVLLQMGILQSWLEVTRLAFPTWMLLAVVSKELRSRFAQGELTH